MTATETEAGGDGNDKLVFVFRIPQNKVSSLKASYFSGSATVKVRTFVDNLRALKQMLYT
jgi:hypothetical protein